jgi:hypothetical protein
MKMKDSINGQLKTEFIGNENSCNTNITFGIMNELP